MPWNASDPAGSGCTAAAGTDPAGPAARTGAAGHTGADRTAVAVRTGAAGRTAGWHRTEWLGIAIGFLGVAALSLDDNLQTNPIGAIAILIAAGSWAFGSIFSRRVSLPSGAMGFATEMLTGGGFILLLGLIRGERISAAPTTQAWAAWVYLVFIGSLLAFSAYMYLLDRVRPAVATSYAYVNPMVAVVLGSLLADEHITPFGLVGMAVILFSVGIITLGRRRA